MAKMIFHGKLDASKVEVFFLAGMTIATFRDGIFETEDADKIALLSAAGFECELAELPEGE